MDKDKPVTQEDLVAHRLLIAEVYELAGESRRSSETQTRELGQTAARWNVLSVVSDVPVPWPAQHGVWGWRARACSVWSMIWSLPGNSNGATIPIMRVPR